jgi:hypothetical protein
MGVSTKEAADLVGLSKAGIFKAIKTGKVSATKDVKGEWRIEPVELFRVYPPVSASQQQPAPPSVQQDIAQSTGSLQREVDLLREMVTDLRSRLDSESEERRRLSLRLEAETEERRKLTLRLTEVHSPAPPSPAQAEVDKPRGFWQRLFSR